MAGTLADAFSTHFALLSYAPEFTDEDEIVWNEATADGAQSYHESGPDTDAVSRLVLWFVGFLPIEWLL
ncbi:hypothetical protein [Ochrobactrum sp. A-1]|jgi:hypothetical protein|uniref:Uncharacterized protein n=1 Tax=Aquamicrobium ahrensii TaxID=469551 RepID=A0ABV2KSX3_9HYPH|nr:hypothetical protein [Ochrobactrum sp. A-1]